MPFELTIAEGKGRGQRFEFAAADVTIGRCAENDVVPFVEKRFRVLAAKDDRAIAGLSMGGGHTLAATNNNPGMFAYIGVFSSGPRPCNSARPVFDTSMCSRRRKAW